MWVAVLALDVATALRGLPAREFRAGALLLLAVAAYLLSHQLVHRASRWRAPKEVYAVAAPGRAGAVRRSFVVSPASAAPPPRHLGAARPLHAPVCFSNCTLISVWEDEVDLSHGQTSLALQFRRAAALSRMLPWLVALVAVAAGLTAGPPHG